jgi:hypothetical protein
MEHNVRILDITNSFFCYKFLTCVCVYRFVPVTCFCQHVVRSKFLMAEQLLASQEQDHKMAAISGNGRGDTCDPVDTAVPTFHDKSSTARIFFRLCLKDYNVQ